MTTLRTYKCLNQFCNLFFEQAGSDGNASDLYFESARFQCRPEHVYLD
jgi:hypothetical protein